MPDPLSAARDEVYGERLQAHLESLQPRTTPPFESLQRRKRSRDMARRSSVAAGLSSLAVAGVVLLPALGNGTPARAPSAAGPSTPTPATPRPQVSRSSEPKVVDTSPLTGAARDFAVKQEAVDAVADRVRSIDDSLAAPRLTGMRVGPGKLALDVWWVGQPPAALTDLAARAGSVSVRAHPGFHAEAEIDDAASRLAATALAADTSARGFDIVAVTREEDGSVCACWSASPAHRRPPAHRCPLPSPAPSRHSRPPSPSHPS